MAIEILTKEPSFFRAGDSYQWLVSYADYPVADSWSLSYTIIGEDRQSEFTASTSGSSYLVTLAPSATAAFPIGKVIFIACALQGVARVTIFQRDTQVLPGYGVQKSGADNRTKAKKALDAMDDALVTMGAKAWTQSYTINNKAITFRNFKEFTDFRDVLKREVAAENNEVAILLGGKAKNKIKRQLQTHFLI